MVRGLAQRPNNSVGPTLRNLLWSIKRRHWSSHLRLMVRGLSLRPNNSKEPASRDHRRSIKEEDWPFRSWWPRPCQTSTGIRRPSAPTSCHRRRQTCSTAKPSPGSSWTVSLKQQEQGIVHKLSKSYNEKGQQCVVRLIYACVHTHSLFCRGGGECNLSWTKIQMPTFLLLIVVRNLLFQLRRNFETGNWCYDFKNIFA
jgi:hypothetical protein